MDKQQEIEVACGLRERRTETWQTLYDTYAVDICDAVARLMGSYAADVADVVQETFLAAARSARHYDPGRGSLWSWLSGIARHHVALYFRKRRQRDPMARENNHVAGQIRQWLDGEADTPSRALVSTELAELVRATLTKLPVHYETILSAKYFDEVSLQQIADERNCSVSAVCSRLARARRAFRRTWPKESPN